MATSHDHDNNNNNSLDGCPSESSSISGNSECNDRHTRNPNNNNEDTCLEPDQASDSSSSRAMLSFVKLRKDEPVLGSSSKVELDFLNIGKSSMLGSSCSWANDINNEGRKDNNNAEEKTSEPRTFSCSFCKREFSSSQALGGHQNAHKQERALQKRRQGVDPGGAFGHPHFPYHPYPSFSSPPLYGSYNRALGVRMESMIHKPLYPWSSGGLRLGHAAIGWSRPGTVLSSTSSAFDRLSMDGLQPLGGGGGGGLGPSLLGSTSALGGFRPQSGGGIGSSLLLGSSSTLRIDHDRGVVAGSVPQSGESSANVATSLSSAIVEKPVDPSGTGDRPNNKQPAGEASSTPESSVLDLSLKL